jgi:aspartyl protease family protein
MTFSCFQGGTPDSHPLPQSTETTIQSKNQRKWVSPISRWELGILLWLSMSGLAIAQPSLTELNLQLRHAVEQQAWQNAIQIIDQMMPLAPEQHESLAQYRQQLQQLQQIQPTVDPNKGITLSFPTGHVPIKRRSNGVVIIDAHFNNRQSFEMLLDSGASVTVITRPMAKALGITSEQIVDYARFSTANGYTELPIVYLQSVEVGGLSMRQVPVAVAGPDMEMGLLGQDFLESYDVSIKRDRVEFHPRP